VSEHFSIAEFACHDGTPYPLEWADRLNSLCVTLEEIRSRWGGPLIVVSGFRTVAYNLRIRGAAHSQHCQGRAADVRALDVSDTGNLANLVRSMLAGGALGQLGGWGIYPGWVHVDVRPKLDGHVAHWHGDGVGSEVA
jgi:uncharacterized protein YcbK (DUF882 family)